MSKPRIYGQQVQIFFSTDGTTFGERIGETNSFESKADHIVKEHSSLGDVGIGTIDVLDNGGTLTMSLDKTDAKFDSFFMNLENHIRAGGQAGKRGKVPYLAIKREETLVDGSVMRTIYEGVVIHSPDDSVTGRTEVAQLKLQGKYKRRRLDTEGVDASGTAFEGLMMLSKARDNYSKLNASTTNEYPEIPSIILYSDKLI